jgi:hypothetical protein
MSPNPEQQRVVRQDVSGVSQETQDGPVVAPSIEESEQVTQSRAGIEHRERTVTDAAGVEHHERFVHDVAGEQRLRLIRISQLVWLCIAVIEAVVGMRVLLKLIGANPNNDFARFVYNLAAVFLAPFFGLTGSPASNGIVLEVPALIAMLVYLFLGWGVVRVVWVLFNRPMTRSSSTYDRYRA